MRRTPDRQTIIKLRAEGLTMAEIGQRYGVTKAAVVEAVLLLLWAAMKWARG